MSPRRPLALVVSVALGCTADAVAQDTTRTRLPPPLVAGGVYDKPGLVSLGSRTVLSGYAEANAGVTRVGGVTDEATFELKRLNLFATAQVSDFVRFATEIEFEDAAQEIRLEFAAVDIGIAPWLTVRGGMLLAPLGRFNLSHDSPRNEFVERPIVAVEMLGVALSEPGAGLLGLVGLGPSSRLTYEVYAVNGFDQRIIEGSPEGTRIRAGRDNFEDNNASPSVVGRVAWSLRRGIELGFSGHYGAYNIFSVDGLRVDDRRNLAVWVLDAEVEVVGVRLSGEGALARVDVPPALTGIYAARQAGFYAEALVPFGRGVVKTMPNSFFGAKARVDVVDFDTDLPGDRQRQLSLGLNFRPTRETVVKLDYVRGTIRDRFNVPTPYAKLLASFATYF